MTEMKLLMFQCPEFLDLNTYLQLKPLEKLFIKMKYDLKMNKRQIMFHMSWKARSSYNRMDARIEALKKSGA